MSVKFAISSGALSLALLLFGHGHLTKAAKDPDTRYIYFDNIPYIANASNIIPMSWSVVEAGFANPIREDIANFTGLDWTKPYPGIPVPGFTTHLRIADHLPFPAVVTEENAVIDVAALNNGIPQSMRKADGILPKAMHPSWFICQHYYVSDLPDAAASDVAHDCSFLPSQCLKDLKADMVANWGAYADETNGSMCGGWTFDTIVPSCIDALGFVTQDVLGFNAAYLQDEVGARDATVDEVGRYTWMVGDGFQEPSDETTYYTAANRTYLVATVFGYSEGYKSSVQPRVELSCLRPKWIAPPEEPAEPTETTTSSSSFAPSSTSTLSSGSASSSKTTSAASSTSSGSSTAMSMSSKTAPASSSSLTLSKTTTTSTAPALPSSTMHCTGGTTAEGISGNLLGLCSYSCDFDHCLSPACVCTRSAAAAVPAPSQLAGKHGCPADNQKPTNSDYAYYVDLCEFICSRGYCPEGACKFC